MSTIFIMMIALLVLWFVISLSVINYDKKMQKNFNALLDKRQKKESN